ncbi:MAG: FTR1 family protein [Betaproteobacteria bacterium]|uniref:FTR1 family iron permease n=1 Tax=Thiomonas sp. FB-6 TaxID=1158291 RepID=UPI00036C34B1|nr:FTR1 family protein [Thiomonas sp. FB-6]MBU6440934.1 FTR1 family protein [Betaproteobacteria bacterium]MBU6512817.1 FTR1 family protein [Betaproteobacteria bacterium]MDE1955147.1 FTR1 family protein [Betaproteobacteria bacterium]MDE2150814.1 FTR1 family protein [Betaproteobacteria bacterium]
MLATAIIMFREVLEAALIVSIVLAAAKGVAGRGRWVSLGVLLGVAGACVVAAFAGAIATAVQGRGQQLLNAAVLLLAVAMLGWHNVWMSRHGKELAQTMRAVGHDVAVGDKPLSVLMVVVMMAVLREGSEAVLFGYGIYASGAGAGSMLAGALAGLAGGVAAGTLLYKGLLRIPTRHLFTVTGWMILLLAAGMATDAAGMLTQAGLLPAIREGVWNSSWLLSQQSMAGRLLHILVGYTQSPSALQLIFYVVTLLGIGSLMWLVNRPRPSPAGSLS